MPKVRAQIEFVGLILMVVKKDGAEALLLDPTAAKGPRHSATLFVPDHQGLGGAPDFVVARPFVKDDTITSEWAGWHLQDKVMFSGSSSPFENKLVETLDVASVAGAKSLRERHCIPVSAAIAIPHGTLSSFGARARYKFFDPPDSKTAKEEEPIPLCERVALGLVTDDDRLQFSITSNGRTRLVNIVPSQLTASIVISNESAGSPDTSDHFGAMFDAVEATRRPRLMRINDQGADDCPDRCDVCINGKFEMKD